MKDGQDETAGSDVGPHGHHPALQVICLGAGGGPSEDDVTGMLVRSVASEWAKGSVLAVDAGSHLAPIIRILERDFPSVSADNKRNSSSASHGNGNGVLSSGLSRSFARTSLSPEPPSRGNEDAQNSGPTVLTSGPFAGLKFPNASARANALHVLHNHISTYLITHPHLDHIAGFVTNTAAFAATSRPKTLAALPSTVDAMKHHVFNDIIWPNLTDEDGGVGFVTFQRLKEGGDLMIGEGEGRGYMHVSDGLGVKPFKVSHGVCTKGPPSHQHRGSIAGISDLQQPPYNGSIQGEPSAIGMARSASMSHNSQYSAPGTPGATPRPNYQYNQQPSPHMAAADQQSCVVDSTAYFIRDTESTREVLIFGDVEPDSLSLSPRNYVIWQEAARKIAYGLLGGIFIECSYDDSQLDAVLFGHLNPRHLIAELQTLASLVTDARAARHMEKSAKKRKRSGPNSLQADIVARHAVGESDRKRSRSLAGRTASKDLRRSSVPDHSMPDAHHGHHQSSGDSPSGDNLSQIQQEHIDHSLEPISPKAVRYPPTLSAASSTTSELPLAGVKVVVIHVKDTLKDGPHVRDNILCELKDYERHLEEDGMGLGCEFAVSRSGESYWF